MTTLTDYQKEEIKNFIRNDLRLELDLNPFTFDGTRLTVSLKDVEGVVLLSDCVTIELRK